MKQTHNKIFIIGKIVKDDGDLKACLYQEGFDVREARGETDVLPEIQDFQPDLILLEATPSYFDMCARLRGILEKSVPLLFIGAPETAYAAQAFAEGAMDYIVEPWREEELLVRLRARLEFSRYCANLEEQAAQAAARVQELTLKAQEATRALRVKNEFVANMSHELRTPLNGILGMAEIMSAGLYGELTNDKQHKAMRIIEESGQQLLSMLSDIIDLAKIETNQQILQRDAAFLEDICNAALGLVKQIANKKHLHVQTRYDPAVQCFYTDPQRLKQMLVTLLNNAVQFTLEQGSIGLEVEGDQARKMLYFTVWDSGVGIAPAQQELLFEPLSRGENDFCSGLGLALVKRLAHMQGGDVRLKSDLGSGSRFTISLPWETVEELSTAPQPEILPPEPAQEEISAPLILVVEDNTANQETLRDYLLAKKYRVTIAGNGQHALDEAQRETPDLVLMDIQMPGMDGFEAIHRLRNDIGLHNTPIIATTALAMTDDEKRCLTAGADAYMSKPLRLKVLLEKIQGMLR